MENERKPYVLFRHFKTWFEHINRKQMEIIEQKKTLAGKKMKPACILLIITLGFVVYANSLGGEFLWDDDFLVKDNTYVKSWIYLPKIFTEHIGAGAEARYAGMRYSFYRPLQMLSYMIDYSVWGLKASGYHLTNILWHILTALSIYVFIKLLFEEKVLSLLTALFFVVHPVHTEVVSYISGRADSLSLFFMLVCFIFYLKQLRSQRMEFCVLVLSSYMLALLSKESSLILPVLLLCYHYAFRKRVNFKLFLPVLTMAGGYILLRLTVLQQLLTYSVSPATFLQRVPGFFVAVTDYLRLLFLPFGLHMEYGYKLFGFTEPKAILGMFIVCLVIIYAFRQKNRNSLVFFSVSWFFITLLPVSNLYPINAYMAEHWLYVPSVGFFLILARVLKVLYERRKSRMLTIVSIAALLSFYSVLTIRQNNYWKGPIVFYERTLKYISYSPAMLNNLGIAYSDIGEHEKAIATYKKAIAMNPQDVYAYNNLGNTYRYMNNEKEALACYKKAIEVNPHYAGAYCNLALLQTDISNKEEAIRLFEQAIKIDPNCERAYYKLGNLYKESGEYDKAVVCYQKVIDINPHQAAAYNNLGNLYHSLGHYEEAIRFFKKAIGMNRGFLQAYYNLGNVYKDIGEHRKAIEMFEKVLEIKADYIEAYNNLGVVYVSIGETEKAVEAFEKIIEINPAYSSAYKNLAVVFYHSKQYAKAVEYYDKALRLGYKPEPEFLSLLEPYRDK